MIHWIVLTLLLTVYSFKSPHNILYNTVTENYYLIIDNTYCKIDNPSETIRTLGFRHSDDTIITNNLTNYRENKKLICPLNLKYHKYVSIRYLDDKTSIEICFQHRKTVYAVANILSNNLQIVQTVLNFGRYMNPSLIPFQRHYLLAYRIKNNTYQSQEINYLNRHFNKLSNITYTSDSYLLKEWEEDARLFYVSNDQILVIFTNIYYFLQDHHDNREFPCMKLLHYHSSNNSFYMSKSIMLQYNESHIKEKNWTPFLYNNELHFIYNIYPLIILKLSDNLNNVIYNNDIFDVINTTLVSIDHCNNMNYKSGSKWNFGKIRGGTQSFHISDLGYFGIFHSGDRKCQINYYFGAYLFSSYKPFQMLKMSYQPIITDELILFNTSYNEKRESVIFPMTYFFQDKHGNILNEIDYHTKKISTVVISAGFNDSNGYLITIHFKHLLESMTDLLSNCSLVN